MNEKSKHRANLNYLSIAKGIAIFLMLWGHCIQYCCNEKIDFFEDDVFRFIYSFHMPLFMLISGYLFYYSFSKRDLHELLKHRIQGLLQPIIMVSFIIYYLTTGLRNIYPRPQISALISGPWLDNLSSLWFLWSLLTLVIIVSINLKITVSVRVRIIVFLFSVILLLTMPCTTHTIYMFPYFTAGFVFSMMRYKHKEKVDQYSAYLKYIFLLLFPLMLCFFRKKHYIYTTGLYSPEKTVFECMRINLFRWGIGFAGSIFIFVILDFIYKYTLYNAVGRRVWGCFENIGKYSLQIYCISVLVVSSYLSPIARLVSKELDLHVLPHNWAVYDFVITPAVAILYVLIIMLIIKIMEKAKISKLIFGR